MRTRRAPAQTKWTALHRAADRGWVDIVRLLLHNGANARVTTTSSGETALHLAAAHGHADITRELLKVGADPRLKANNGWTPLHAAMFNNHPEVARALIRAGADPDEVNKVSSEPRATPPLPACPSSRAPPGQ